MRRLSLIAAFVLVSVLAFAQIYKLTVTKNDGQTVVIPTDEIEKIEFTEELDGEPLLYVTPESETVPYIGGKLTIKVSANCPWSYTVDNDLVTEVSKTRAQLVLDFPWCPSDGIKYNVEFTYGDKTTGLTIGQESGIRGDLLDIEYLADGSAVDRSPLNNKVITTEGAGLMTYYSDVHKRYVATFRHPMGDNVTTGYYRINYEKNGDFINRIADGCTMETTIKLNEADAPGKEVKWFSSMQAGGIGFILPVHNSSNPGTKCMTFLPNISTTGSSKWCWVYSDVEPVPGTYYHVVGVYNKAEGRSYIYINGRLSGQAATPGDYVPVVDKAESFIIGGDPGPNQTDCSASWNGEVVTARIYDAPMTADQVAKLWEKADFEEEAVNTISVTDLQYLSQAEVAPGYKYYVYGKGFEAGDVVELQAVGSDDKYMPETVASDGQVVFTIPEGLPSGRYRVILKRGNAQLPLIQVDLSVVAEPLAPSVPKIIAHRGAHTGGATENSIAALKKAMDANYYGIELDLWITTDGKLIVHHDGEVNGVVFYQRTYDQIKDIKLANGEYLPTFDSFLETYKEKMANSTSKLIIEIKTHLSTQSNQAAIDKAMAMVEEAGIKDRVEYIAFSFDNCKYILSKQPDAIVGYLSGNLAPATVLAAGIKSVDYSSGAYVSNPTWIKEARKLGMIVNVWTVNSASEMINYMAQGVDYITTDDPALLRTLTEKPFVSAE